jgi:hypothetical protein
VRVEQIDDFADDLLMNKEDHWFAFDDWIIPTTLTDYRAFEMTISLFT